MGNKYSNPKMGDDFKIKGAPQAKSTDVADCAKEEQKKEVSKALEEKIEEETTNTLYIKTDVMLPNGETFEYWNEEIKTGLDNINVDYISDKIIDGYDPDNFVFSETGMTEISDNSIKQDTYDPDNFYFDSNYGGNYSTENEGNSNNITQPLIASTYKASKNLENYIVKHEGFSEVPYYDDWGGSKNRIEYSIGFGHQIQVVLEEDQIYGPFPTGGPGRVLLKEYQIKNNYDMMLKNDPKKANWYGLLIDYEKAKSIQLDDLNKNAMMLEKGGKGLTPIKKGLTQNQFDAVLDLTFNIGIGAVQPLVILINNNASSDDIKKEFKRHIYWKKKINQTLVTLREKEIEMYFNNVYP